MQWIAGSGMDTTTYANVLFSGAFAIYLAGASILELYERLATPASKDDQRRSEDLERAERRATWWGGVLPRLERYFPGAGSRLGGARGRREDVGAQGSGDAAYYEAVPLTATSDPSGSLELGENHFAVGGLDAEEEEEEGRHEGSERFWEEKRGRVGV